LGNHLELYDAAKQILAEISTNLFFLQYSEFDIDAIERIIFDYSNKTPGAYYNFYRCLRDIAKFNLSVKDEELSWDVFKKYYSQTTSASLYSMKLGEEYDLT
jgi:hypothetical protein